MCLRVYVSGQPQTGAGSRLMLVHSERSDVLHETCYAASPLASKQHTCHCERFTMIYRPAVCCAASASSSTSTSSDLQQLKSKLIKMSGNRTGVDLSAEQKKEVLEHFKKFEGLGMENPEQQELDGTKWQIIFNDSKRALYLQLSHVRKDMCKLS